MLPFLLSVGGVFRLPVTLQERFSLAGTVQRFSWQRLELVALGWGPAGQESVQIDALSVEFSPLSLFQKKVSALTLSGLTLHLLKGPDGFTLRGFTLPQMTHASAADQAWHLPLGVGRLDILQGRILIHEQGALKAVPFQGHLLMDEESPQRLQFALDLWPGISGVSVSGEIDLDARMVQGDIACQLPVPVTDGSLTGKFSVHLVDDGIWHLTTAARLEGGVKGSAEKIVVGGTLTGKARLHLHDGRREASAEMVIKDGRFANADLGQEVSGITGKVSFPDLLGLRSDTAQFSLQKVKFGELSLTEGAVAFRLEGEKGLFVEKASANWSEGIVRASALRFTPGNSDFEVELSCERLSLAQLFGQLGIGKFSGNGILNGRIPLSYKDGVLRVVGGLLHSPPSAGGSIHMVVHDLITAGVPADAPQFGQLEFAAAALQDFIYQSLSVALDSKGDNLAVAMKLDGRSAKPLPFRYDAGAGTFRRVSAAGEVGIDQPVQLDVNFLLPVDTLLDYGKEIKSLWDKVQ